MVHVDCVGTTRLVSASVTGVTAASADREAAQATVEGDAATDDLLAAVEDAGYEAST